MELDKQALMQQLGYGLAAAGGAVLALRMIRGILGPLALIAAGWYLYDRSKHSSTATSTTPALQGGGLGCANCRVIDTADYRVVRGRGP